MIQTRTVFDERLVPNLKEDKMELFRPPPSSTQVLGPPTGSPVGETPLRTAVCDVLRLHVPDLEASLVTFKRSEDPRAHMTYQDEGHAGD